MPDLMTHVSAAYFLRKLPKISKCTVIFFVGNILPDILTRPFYIIFPGTYWFIYPFHTLFVLFLVCILISHFFEENVRKIVFFCLLAGVFLHLFLDMFQEHLTGVNYWLFPFSDIDVGIGLFGQDKSVYAIPFILIYLGLIKIVFFFKRRSKL